MRKSWSDTDFSGYRLEIAFAYGFLMHFFSHLDNLKNPLFSIYLASKLFALIVAKETK